MTGAKRDMDGKECNNSNEHETTILFRARLGG